MVRAGAERANSVRRRGGCWRKANGLRGSVSRKGFGPSQKRNGRQGPEIAFSRASTDQAGSGAAPAVHMRSPSLSTTRRCIRAGPSRNQTRLTGNRMAPQRLFRRPDGPVQRGFAIGAGSAPRPIRHKGYSPFTEWPLCCERLSTREMSGGDKTTTNEMPMPSTRSIRARRASEPGDRGPRLTGGTGRQRRHVQAVRTRVPCALRLAIAARPTTRPPAPQTRLSARTEWMASWVTPCTSA